MRGLIVLLLLSGTTSLRIQLPEQNSDGFYGVLGRLPSWVSEEFNEIVVTSKSKELVSGTVKLIGTDDGVNIEATTAIDALYGVHAYIREFCGSLVSWEGRNVPKTVSCQRPENFERVFTSPKVRYFGNPCTFSYSFAWWDWSKWERIIDWLALSGFNMVLAPIGQEAIWRQVWMELGVSADGVDEFFTGPAFHAWHRMGNLQHLGGPMSEKFLLSQLELNKLIVSRLNELGIVPVLPTFAGFVPKEFAARNSDLKYLTNGCWNKFNETNSCLTSLHPEEPMFQKIAKLFVEKQKSIYGPSVTNVYSSDPFNESPPAHLDDDQLASMSSAIHKGCTAGDDKCIWVLQSWTFSYDSWTKSGIKSFLSAVPVGSLLVLDLQAEKRPLHRELEDFYGHYFVWCLLHNFGGSIQLRGNLGKLEESFVTSSTSSKRMIGSGLTMEAINQNYVLYQFFIDVTFADGIIDPFQWIEMYVYSRYGSKNKDALTAWRVLLSTFYTQKPKSRKLSMVARRELDERRPVYLYFTPGFNKKLNLWFDSKYIGLGHFYFARANLTLGDNELFREDFSDMNREKLQFDLHHVIQNIDDGKTIFDDKGIIRDQCDVMEKLWEELDVNARYHLSDWINMARASASSESEADDFERQARNQLTLWGPNGEISDYARKEWGGLIRKYYAKRWSFFCDHLLSLPKGTDLNEKKFKELLFLKVELPFAKM